MSVIRVSLFAIALTSVACASIISGTSQTLTFESSPSGAQLILNGIAIGETPLEAEIQRSRNSWIVLRKEGFLEQRVELTTRENPWIWGNSIIGGIAGSVTDVGNGASRRYVPNAYHVTLEPEGMPAESRRRFERKRALRDLALSLHGRLGRELATGHHSEALSTLLARAPGLSASAVEEAYFSPDSDDPVSFADRIAESLTDGPS